MTDFRTFGDKFAKAWASGWANRVAQPGFKVTYSISGTDERKSDSLLHPVVWVLSTQEFTNDAEFNMDLGFVCTFYFAWDGRRWHGLESVSKNNIAIGAGGPPDNIDQKFSEKSVDDVALRCQTP